MTKKELKQFAELYKKMKKEILDYAQENGDDKDWIMYEFFDVVIRDGKHQVCVSDEYDSYHFWFDLMDLV